jgi:hypothetical protein
MNPSDNHNDNTLKPWLWKKGQSGNILGRPKGKTMKEYVKDYLSKMNDEERDAWLEGIPKEIIWRLAEGNPTNEITGKDGKDLIPDVIAKEKIDKAISSYINGNTKDSR